MNSIFIDSFTFRYRESSTGIFYHRWYNETYPQFGRKERLEFLNNILSSLLIHDKLYIKIDAVEEFVDLIGYAQFLELLQEELVGVIDDTGAHIRFLVQSNNYLMLMNMAEDSTMSIESIEKRLKLKENTTSGFGIIEKYIIPVDGHWLGHIAEEELYSDLRNENLTSSLKINSSGITDIHPNESLVISRLMNINRSLVYLYENGISNVHIDGFSKQLINLKFLRSINELHDNTIDLFNEIVRYKEIPDFSVLYQDKKIDLDDILKIRNNFNGGKFRDWYNSTNYNKHQTYNELLKYHDKSYLEQGIRFLITSVLGLINPIIGISSSLIDSFIVDKVINNKWSPNIFLDLVLKKKLDNKNNSG